MDNNELINLFLDNNLNESQRVEFEKLLKTDKDFKNSFEIYLLAVKTVKDIPLYSPSDKFTGLLMNKLKIVKKYDDGKFFKIIILSFIILLIFILAVIINYPLTSQSGISIIKPELLKGINLKGLLNYIKSENILIILSSISLLLLIGIYYIQYSFNKLKKQLI